MDIWGLLEISPTKDIKIIKKAYAEKVKLYHPEDNPKMFSRIHEAYLAAVEYAKNSSLEKEITYSYTADTKQNNQYSSQYHQDFDYAKEYRNQSNSADENSEQDDIYGPLIDKSIKDYYNIVKKEIDDFMTLLASESHRLTNTNEFLLLDYMLRYEVFIKYKDHPYMLSLLEQLIKTDIINNRDILASLFYAYNFYQLRNSKDKGVYEPLFSILDTKIPVPTNYCNKLQAEITYVEPPKTKLTRKKFLIWISILTGLFSILVFTYIYLPNNIFSYVFTIICLFVTITSFIVLKAEFDRSKKMNFKKIMFGIIFNLFLLCTLFGFTLLKVTLDTIKGY